MITGFFKKFIEDLTGKLREEIERRNSVIVDFEYDLDFELELGHPIFLILKDLPVRPNFYFEGLYREYMNGYTIEQIIGVIFEKMEGTYADMQNQFSKEGIQKMEDPNVMPDENSIAQAIPYGVVQSLLPGENIKEYAHREVLRGVPIWIMNLKMKGDYTKSYKFIKENPEITDEHWNKAIQNFMDMGEIVTDEIRSEDGTQCIFHLKENTKRLDAFYAWAFPMIRKLSDQVNDSLYIAGNGMHEGYAIPDSCQEEEWVILPISIFGREVYLPFKEWMKVNIQLLPGDKHPLLYYDRETGNITVIV